MARKGIGGHATSEHRIATNAPASHRSTQHQSKFAFAVQREADVETSPPGPVTERVRIVEYRRFRLLGGGGEGFCGLM